MSKLIQCQECQFIAPEQDLILGGDPASDGYCGPQCSVCDGIDFDDFEGYEINEYISGMRDCRDGVKHESKTVSYNAGYSAEYTRQQIMAVTREGY